MKGESGGSWPAAPPVGWGGAGQGQGHGSQADPYPLSHKGTHQGGTKLAGERQRRGEEVFLGLHSLSRLYSECLPRPLSPLTVWQFLVIFQDTPVTCHLLHGVSLTGRTSGPFSELPEAHSFFFFFRSPFLTIDHSVLPPPVSASDPHLNWGQEQACRSPGCPVSDRSRPVCLLNE